MQDSEQNHREQNQEEWTNVQVDERIEEIMAGIFDQQFLQVITGKLKARQTLVQSQSTCGCVRHQDLVVGRLCVSERSN